MPAIDTSANPELLSEQQRNRLRSLFFTALRRDGDVHEEWTDETPLDTSSVYLNTSRSASIAFVVNVPHPDGFEPVVDEVETCSKPHSTNGNPIALSDLGAEYSALEQDLWREAIIMCDLPADLDRLTEYVTEDPELVASGCYDGQLQFLNYLYVPESVQTLYDGDTATSPEDAAPRL